METKYSEEEDSDRFYKEIEQRIMHVISDDEEEEQKMKSRAPLLVIHGRRPVFYPTPRLILEVNWYGPFDLGARQRRMYFGYVNWRKWAWQWHGRAVGIRVPAAKARKGTGVFIPKCA